jgi:hypothetical protein
MQIVAPAGGWLKALEKLRTEYFAVLERNLNCRVLVLIDCDQDPNRIVEAIGTMPEHLRERIFVLGTLRDPESLQSAMKMTLETIGEQIANECFEEEANVWKHPDLIHNQPEVASLKQSLFSAVFLA